MVEGKDLELLYFCAWCGILHDLGGCCKVCGRELLRDFVEITEIQKKGLAMTQVTSKSVDFQK